MIVQQNTLKTTERGDTLEKTTQMIDSIEGKMKELNKWILNGSRWEGRDKKNWKNHWESIHKKEKTSNNHRENEVSWKKKKEQIVTENRYKPTQNVQRLIKKKKVIRCGRRKKRSILTWAILELTINPTVTVNKSRSVSLYSTYSTHYKPHRVPFERRLNLTSSRAIGSSGKIEHRQPQPVLLNFNDE